MSSRAVYVSVFFPENTDGIVRVHGSECTHVHRDWRAYGAPIKMYVESEKGIIRQLKSQGIRFSGLYVLPCALIPEGFWSFTPDGERLGMLSTYQGAKTATRRFRQDLALSGQRPEHHKSVYNVG